MCVLPLVCVLVSFGGLSDGVIGVLMVSLQPCLSYDALFLFSSKYGTQPVRSASGPSHRATIGVLTLLSWCLT